jgi:hypothetical protein
MARTKRQTSWADCATEDGFPGYVRGWCYMAKSKTMQRGYRDVGYLIAERVAEFRPAQFNARSWREQVEHLKQHAKRDAEAAVQRWFLTNYPTLMHLIPKRRHLEFVAGFIERTREEMASLGGDSSRALGT